MARKALCEGYILIKGKMDNLGLITRRDGAGRIKILDKSLNLVGIFNNDKDCNVTSFQRWNRDTIVENDFQFSKDFKFVTMDGYESDYISNYVFEIEKLNANKTNNKINSVIRQTDTRNYVSRETKKEVKLFSPVEWLDKNKKSIFESRTSSKHGFAGKNEVPILTLFEMYINASGKKKNSNLIHSSELEFEEEIKALKGISIENGYVTYENNEAKQELEVIEPNKVKKNNDVILNALIVRYDTNIGIVTKEKSGICTIIPLEDIFSVKRIRTLNATPLNDIDIYGRFTDDNIIDANALRLVGRNGKEALILIDLDKSYQINLYKALAHIGELKEIHLLTNKNMAIFS